METTSRDHSRQSLHVLGKDSVYLNDDGKTGENPSRLSKLIIHNSHSGILILNNSFTCVYANPEAARILAYPTEKIVGSDFRDYLPDTQKDKIADLYIRRQNGELLPNRYVTEFIRSDGEHRTAEISVDAMLTSDNQVVTTVQVFDISDRVCMERQMEKSEKKYHDFFENVLDFIFIHDLDGNIIESNARYVTEVGAHPDIVQNANLRDLMPEKYRPEFKDYVKRIKKNGRDEGIIAIQVPEGEIRVLEYKNILMYDDARKPTGVMGSARDITEHIRDKKALRESKERYQMILENVGDYIYELDLEGNYTFVNDALVKRSGYTKDQLIGKNYREYTLPEEKDLIRKYHQDIFLTGETGKGMQHRVIRKDGSSVYVELVASLIKDTNGEPAGFRGVARDVTERKLAEKILRESENKLKEIIEGSPIATIVVSSDDSITHWNRACEALTGIKSSDVCWKSLKEVETIINHPILPGSLINHFSAKEISAYYDSPCRKSDVVKNAYEVESFFPHLGRNGKWLLLTLALLKDHENRVVGVIETLLDVTSQKRAEKNLLRMHEALEEKVDERTRELRDVNIALEVLLTKRDKDKKKFEDKVAYNIKEILTPHLELLKGTNLTKQQRVYLEILEDNFREIASPFMSLLSDNMQKITRTELQIISLIKQNKISKEIAELMGISTRTVETHRDNIRKKLGIKNKAVNLRTYLLNSKV